MLVDNGVIDASQLQKAIDPYSGLPTLDLEDLEIAHETEKLLSLDARRKFLAIPYFKDDDSLWVVMADPTDIVEEMP